MLQSMDYDEFEQDIIRFTDSLKESNSVGLVGNISQFNPISVDEISYGTVH